MAEHDYYTLEMKGENRFVVYGWGTYPSYSVLAGQAKKQFLDSYETEAEARASVPGGEDMNWGSRWTDAQNTFDHLPDTPDW